MLVCSETVKITLYVTLQGKENFLLNNYVFSNTVVNSIFSLTHNGRVGSLIFLLKVGTVTEKKPVSIYGEKLYPGKKLGLAMRKEKF